MADELIPIGDGFYNIRGSFKLAGMIDIGTQASLVQLQRGDFVLLDSYPLTGELAERVLSLTDQGRAVRAILNLHPFHTTHVAATAEQFPQAELYGTLRHKQQAPSLSWQALQTDDQALHEKFADDLSFTVPRGVDLIPHSSVLHFASVLAVHNASRTMHVDDTLSWSSLPLMQGLSFHPTLRFALQKRPGAAAEFRSWAEQLTSTCAGLKQLCTAHSRKLPELEVSIEHSVKESLGRVSAMLEAHAKRYG